MTREDERDMACTNWICSQENGTVIKAREVWKAAVKWADQHPQWIPVEERLPEAEEDNPSLSVNVVVTDGCSWFESYYNFKLRTWVGARLYGTITHWMEIVLPRKEE